MGNDKEPPGSEWDSVVDHLVKKRAEASLCTDRKRMTGHDKQTVPRFPENRDKKIVLHIARKSHRLPLETIVPRKPALGNRPNGSLRSFAHLRHAVGRQTRLGRKFHPAPAFVDILIL